MIIAASLACYALKLLGLSVPRRVLDHPVVSRVGDLLPVVLLATLIATQTFTQGRALTIDARAAGLVAALVAERLRAPFLVIVGSAAITAALVRAIA
jgi:uncharacterized membrane protein